jgi:hypothetical protein
MGVLTREWKKSLKPFRAGGGGDLELEFVRDIVRRE